MRRIMRSLGLAEYGGDELLLGIICCGATAAALWLVWPWLALLPLLPLSVIFWFFRDPERKGSEDPALLLSPADGTVMDIQEVDEPEFIQGRALRIGIFLSPLNVHVNRAPCEGVVLYVKHRTGEFLPAYNPQAPERNESVALGLQRPDGTRLLVKQITGVLARRIVCETPLGATLARGQRYGMIKFGSRTELYVPVELAAETLIGLKTVVRGGETVFCRLRAPSTPASATESTNQAASETAQPVQE